MEPIEIEYKDSLDLFIKWIHSVKVPGVIIYPDALRHKPITQRFITQGISPNRLRPQSQSINFKQCREPIAAIALEYNCDMHGNDDYDPKKNIRQLIRCIQPNLVISLALRIPQTEFSRNAQSYSSIINAGLRNKDLHTYLSKNYRYGPHAFRLIRVIPKN